MKILMTGATSQVAYHLLPVLASGGVIGDQNIELILCDCANASSELEGLVCELQDCGYSTLTGITVTDNFIESCKTADVVISLPSQTHNCRRLCTTDVSLSSTSLTQMDFDCLNYAMFPTFLSKNNTSSVRSHGPFSTANAICQYLSQLYQKSLQDIQREKDNRREEAQFGCPPDLSIVDIDTPHYGLCQAQRALDVQRDIMFISVIVNSVSENEVLKEKDNTYQIETKIYARL